MSRNPHHYTQVVDYHSRVSYGAASDEIKHEWVEAQRAGKPYIHRIIFGQNRKVILELR